MHAHMRMLACMRIFQFMTPLIYTLKNSEKYFQNKKNIFRIFGNQKFVKQDFRKKNILIKILQKHTQQYNFIQFLQSSQMIESGMRKRFLKQLSTSRNG